MAKDFVARSGRFDLNLPIRFFPKVGLVNGHCINVSDTGMLVVFDKPVELWLQGDLSVAVDGGYASIKSVVARVEGLEAGMAFLAENEDEKKAIERLMAFARKQNQPTIRIAPV